MSDPIEIMARAIYHATPRNKPFELLGQHARQYEKKARSALSALRDAGFVVVPVKPTEAMYEAALEQLVPAFDAGAAYRAMIQAAQVTHDEAATRAAAKEIEP